MSNEVSMCCCELYQHLPIGPINTNLSNITNYFWRTQITFTLHSLFQILCLLHPISPSSFLFSLSFPTTSENNEVYIHTFCKIKPISNDHVRNNRLQFFIVLLAQGHLNNTSTCYCVVWIGVSVLSSTCWKGSVHGP